MGLRADLRTVRRELAELPADETLRIRGEAVVVTLVGWLCATPFFLGGAAVLVLLVTNPWRGHVDTKTAWEIAWALGLPFGLGVVVVYGTAALVHRRLRRGLDALRKRAPPRVTAGVGGSSSVAVPVDGA